MNPLQEISASYLLTIRLELFNQASNNRTKQFILKEASDYQLLYYSMKGSFPLKEGNIGNLIGIVNRVNESSFVVPPIDSRNLMEGFNFADLIEKITGGGEKKKNLDQIQYKIDLNTKKDEVYNKLYGKVERIRPPNRSDYHGDLDYDHPNYNEYNQAVELYEKNESVLEKEYEILQDKLLKFNVWKRVNPEELSKEFEESYDKTLKNISKHEFTGNSGSYYGIEELVHSPSTLEKLKSPSLIAKEKKIAEEALAAAKKLKINKWITLGVLGTLIGSVIIIAAAYAYMEQARDERGKCRAIKDQLKSRVCLLDIDIRLSKQQIEDLKNKLSACVHDKDPKRCTRLVRERILYLEKNLNDLLSERHRLTGGSHEGPTYY